MTDPLLAVPPPPTAEPGPVPSSGVRRWAFGCAIVSFIGAAVCGEVIVYVVSRNGLNPTSQFTQTLQEALLTAVGVPGLVFLLIGLFALAGVRSRPTRLSVVLSLSGAVVVLALAWAMLSRPLPS